MEVIKIELGKNFTYQVFITLSLNVLKHFWGALVTPKECYPQATSTDVLRPAEKKNVMYILHTFHSTHNHLSLIDLQMNSDWSACSLHTLPIFDWSDIPLPHLPCSDWSICLSKHGEIQYRMEPIINEKCTYYIHSKWSPW